MISVITPLYNTPPDVLARTWASLKRQTHTDWEWVVWDDSTNDRAWAQVYGFASDERYRLTMHRSHTHSGNIGQVKRQAFMVATGDILVELDHDDELLPHALERINSFFDGNPAHGFVYSDWCEILPDGQSGRYPEGWAFGFGSDYWSAEHGVWVMKAPPVNSTTMRHIVSAPNHVRAWRAGLYREMNGHTPLRVADDYDLVVRTFMRTRMGYIPELLYRQHVGPHTAQRVHNKEIQEHVANIAEKYNDAITARCQRLGVL
jgi:glycosyltransferase involved in cell wall biosynthesis